LLAWWTFRAGGESLRFLAGDKAVMIRVGLAELLLKSVAFAAVVERFLQRQASILIRIGGIELCPASVCAGNVLFLPGQLAIMVEIPTGKDLCHEVVTRLIRAELAIVVCIGLREPIHRFSICGAGLSARRRAAEESEKTCACEADKWIA